jgi:hypothetical protein
MYVRTSDRLGQINPFEPLEPPEFLKPAVEWVKQRVKQPELLKRAVAPAVPLVEYSVRRAKAPGILREKACWIQNVLNKTSSGNLVPDGLYGPRTREAVRQFQTRSGLPADGVIGPRTNTALIQIALNHIAQASLLPVDGVMDARGQQEIKRFQSRNGLAPDGIVGPRTRAAMVLALGGQCPVLPTVKPPGNGHVIVPGCDQPEYERLQKHCQGQAIQGIANSARQFGVDEKWAIKIAQATIRLAMRAKGLPPIAGVPIPAIIAILGSIPAGILNARAIHRLATAIREILIAYITCVRNAKEATRC